MANIHKSKEVYKYTDTANGNKLVPVRGLYVSGTHKEPWYIDHAITITGFTSTEEIVASYTAAETDVVDNDSALVFTGISFTDVDLVNYYSDSMNLYDSDVTSDDSALSFTGLSFIGIDMVSYYSSNESVYDSQVYSNDSVLEFVSFSTTMSSYMNLQVIKKPQNPQPAITLTQFTSSTEIIQSI